MSYMIPRTAIVAMSIVAYKRASHPSLLIGLRSIHLKYVLLDSTFIIFEIDFNAIEPYKKLSLDYVLFTKKYCYMLKRNTYNLPSCRTFTRRDKPWEIGFRTIPIIIEK